MDKPKTALGTVVTVETLRSEDRSISNDEAIEAYNVKRLGDYVARLIRKHTKQWIGEPCTNAVKDNVRKAVRRILDHIGGLGLLAQGWQVEVVADETDPSKVIIRVLDRDGKPLFWQEQGNSS